MSKPKRKPRGVVARFLTGDSVSTISYDSRAYAKAVRVTEAILRRALRKAQADAAVFTFDPNAHADAVHDKIRALGNPHRRALAKKGGKR